MWQGPGIGFVAETGTHATITALNTIFSFLYFPVFLAISVVSLSVFSPPAVIFPVSPSPSSGFMHAAVMCSS